MSASSFSLLREPWLPARRRHSGRGWIAPPEITAGIDGDDPVVGIDWGRADFDAASLEFLIGLLATACPPKSEDDWAGRYETPPTPQMLAAAFTPFETAFLLDGDGPRFMQEYGGLEGEEVRVSGLLIEAPGIQTERHNADLFQKRGRFPALGLPAAAMALFTLQTYAPSGGAGHRTSLRGGGPLTTLVLPPDTDTLWAKLWFNVPEFKDELPADLSRVFPWLAPTQTSEGKKPALGPGQIDPRGVFWGMPRRIRLEFGEAGTDTRCALTGEPAERVVTGYRTRPWGMHYGLLAHPLSPMYRQKLESEWLYLHPQPGGLSYRHWLDMATEIPEKPLRQLAQAVKDGKARLQALGGGVARLQAVGYDIDQMKARGFVETQFPLFTNRAVDDWAPRLVAAAQEVAGSLVMAVREALNIEKPDAALLAALREEFFASTQALFFEQLAILDARLPGGDKHDEIVEGVAQTFLGGEGGLRRTALALFDRHAPLIDPVLRGTERIVKTRLDLVWALTGYGKRGVALFGVLILPAPASAAKEKKPKRSKS